jgi:hypothetical protein
MADVRSDPTKVKRRVAAIDARLWKLVQRSALLRRAQDTERARLLRRIVRRLAERAHVAAATGTPSQRRRRPSPIRLHTV